MSTRKTIDIDLNRVEGDLEFQLDIEDGLIVDARCKGIMYRGFEQLMIGRDASDSVVLTSRVCGICGTAHMYTSVLALEQIWSAPVPELATLVRNACLATENAQSDLRHSFLMFTPDFCNEKYINEPFYSDASVLFEPFKGRIYRQVLQHSRRLLEIVAIFGGQWPHSTYMVPGGVVSEPDHRKVIDSQSIVFSVKKWFEEEVLGGSTDDWMQVNSHADLMLWMEKHPNATLTKFNQMCFDLKLDQMGAGADLMLSYGAYCKTEGWVNQGPESTQAHWVKAGTYDLTSHTTHAFDQELIEEHVKYSWFKDYGDGLHPSQGQTIPDYQQHTDQYTWAKAPRYDGRVAQTGPLAEQVIGGNLLLKDLLVKCGDSVWLRQFARIIRVAQTLNQLNVMLEGISQRVGEPHIIHVAEEQKIDGSGFGLIQAARGALGHWLTIKDGKIDRFQIITPTAWNASPKDSSGTPGHWEKSVLGLSLGDPDNPVEIGHIVRSHDACLVCTVHMLDKRLQTRQQRTYGL